MATKIKLSSFDTPLSRGWVDSPGAGIIFGILYISLNLADAWLTNLSIGLGGIERNPIVRLYGGNMAIKCSLALIVLVLLFLFKKERLLLSVNALLAIIVLWNLIGVLSFEW